MAGTTFLRQQHETGASRPLHSEPGLYYVPRLPNYPLHTIYEQHRGQEAAELRRGSSGSIGRASQPQQEDVGRRHRPRTQDPVEAVGYPAKGRDWNMTHVGGGVRLSGGPVLTDNETSALESDASSVIDISSALGPSDTEDERVLGNESERDPELEDTHKYRMPDAGKTRLCSRTKEPLSPQRPSASVNAMASNKPLPAVPAALESETPSSPSRTTSSSTITATGNRRTSNGGTDFSQAWNVRNSSTDDLSTSDSDFARPTLSRANSVYTLGRASFTGQLATLTAMRLPDAESLAKRISALPTSVDAAKALSDAGDQIRLWIAKASDVLEGLNAEHDVEWAAAGGGEGIDDVNAAINRFERLVEVYIVAIEELQTRDDIRLLSGEDIKASGRMMEDILASWTKIKDTLSDVRKQVEIAMEWQQLWDNVLGEVAQEMAGLHRLVFEMEENRHQGSESVLSSKDSIDISELETIVEEQPGRSKLPHNRFSIALTLPNGAPMTSPTTQHREDASLLALFARMQPLRASLDFLPMRMSSFQSRGYEIFPSACIDLEQRIEQFESQWKKLEADADSLRRELGEDRWVIVFRNAGRQALKMYESITRSFQKLKDAVETHQLQQNLGDMQTRIENYEQKKRHYGPAIERVLAIIDRGVTERLTVNGEILRLQSDMKQRWASLQSEMHATDVAIEPIKQDLANIERRDQNLRDSVSTVISSERSIGSSLGIDTPGSSPASSVVTATSRKGSFESQTPTPLTSIRLRGSSSKPENRTSLTPSSIPRRTLFTKRSSTDMRSSQRSEHSSVGTTSTPSKQPVWPSRPEPLPAVNKPRFTAPIKAESRDFKPLSAYEPSPYAKDPMTPKHNYLRSGLGNNIASTGRVSQNGSRMSSAPSATPTSIPRPASSVAQLRKSSLPGSQQQLPTPSKPRQSLTSKASAPALRPSSRLNISGRRSSMMPTRELAEEKDGNEADNEAPAHQSHSTPRRPLSSLANGRRSGLLTGRRSRLELQQTDAAGGTAPVEKIRPPWRP